MEYLNETIKSQDFGDFPGHPMFRNLPATAGNTCLISGMGRFCVPWSNWSHVPQVLKPVDPRAHAPQQESGLH